MLSAEPPGDHQRYGDLLLHGESEVHKVCLARHGAGLYLLLGHFFHTLDSKELRLLISAARDLDDIDAGLLKPFRNLNAVSEFKTAFLKICTVEFHRNRKIWSYRLANGSDYLQQGTCAVFKRATIVVCAQVGARAEKLREQIAVGGVYLHTGKTCLLAGFCADAEAFCNVDDLGCG